MHAQIVAPGFRYRLTDEDVLWAARMADGEGDRDAPQVLWAMTQRFAGLVRRGSFKSFIMNYSQPINPKWRRDGICCAQGAVGCPARHADGSRRSWFGEEPCDPRRLARRDGMARKAWDDIPVVVRRAVTAWASARLPNPVPRAVDFATRDLVMRRVARDPSRKIVDRAGSWFITSERSNSWGPNHVVMQLDGRVARASTGPGLLGILAVGGAAWVGVRVAQGKPVVPRALSSRFR
jgi:hypothetical protein